MNETLQQVLMDEHILLLGKLRKAHRERNREAFVAYFEIYTCVTKSMEAYRMHLVPAVKDEILKMYGEMRK